MKTAENTHVPGTAGNPGIDISHKLTTDDIDKIEKYRQIFYLILSLKLEKSINLMQNFKI